MDKLRPALHVIDGITEITGKICSFAIIILIGILMSEVVLRYFFKSPTIWVEEMSQYLFSAYFLLGGAYTFYFRGHVKMDAIYIRFSPRGRAILDSCTAFLFFFLMGILTWQGGEIFWTALTRMERSMSYWAPPTFPMKMMIPIGCFLLLLQGLGKFARDIIMAITGKEMEQ